MALSSNSLSVRRLAIEYYSCFRAGDSLQNAMKIESVILNQHWFILSNILSLTLNERRCFQIKGQNHRMADVNFFSSYISFHLHHNGSKVTQMLLLIMPILYSHSVISLGGYSSCRWHQDTSKLQHIRMASCQASFSLVGFFSSGNVLDSRAALFQKQFCLFCVASQLA